MKNKYHFLLGLAIFFLLSALGWGLPLPAPSAQSDQPIVVIIADKMNSMELYNTQLPALRKLLKSGDCGLMNIRSSKGYTDSASGYLSLGAGSRGNAIGQPADSLDLEQFMSYNPSTSYNNWRLGIPLKVGPDHHLFVPDVGWLINLALLDDHQVVPGRLGSLFHHQGWRTCLIGTVDSADQENRPGGLFLMDRRGVIDEGAIDPLINKTDFGFPYLYRANVPQIISELRQHLAKKKVIAIDFGDFARLDNFRDQMSPTLYAHVKGQTWRRLDLLVDQLFHLGAPEMFTTILLSPSISWEGTATKNLLAPIVIYRQNVPPGILISGTTRWPGLVANVDLLPTLAAMTQFQKTFPFTGKVITCQPAANNINLLRSLNQRLVTVSVNQRPIINWYQGIISCCWIAGLLGAIFLKKRWISDFIISLVIVIPLTLIIQPLFPLVLWHIGGFIILTILLAAAFTRIHEINTRILILSALIWAILILDQVTGWRLIRFSALGYSPMAGSRYYGLGNEFLGIFLASALLLTDLINRKTQTRWSTPIILGLTIFILSWPQFGAKFGGIIAGTIGFVYYLIKLYHWKLKNRRLWVVLSGCCLVLFAIGWWDSLRPADAQTHIGRFLHLILSKDFEQVSQIIFRKIAMDLKLTISSPWIRIIVLAGLLGIVQRWLTAKKMLLSEDTIVWQAILAAGITSYLVNDAGVLAFATCLAYGFSYLLLKVRNQVDPALIQKWAAKTKRLGLRASLLN